MKSYVYVLVILALVLITLGASGTFTGTIVSNAALTGNVVSTSSSGSCLDSDGGFAYYTAGFVEIRGKQYFDECLSATKLKEYFCRPRFYFWAVPGYVTYTCPYGCENDACKQKQAQVIECKAGQIIGDVDGNGVVTLTDANLSADIALGKINPPADLCCVDINKDGVVNVLDTVQITNIANGKMTSPGVCGQVTCTDTDGGKNYEVKGTCSSNNPLSLGENTDSCFDSKSVTEYYCENNPTQGWRCSGIANYQCPTGYMCSDGACIVNQTVTCDAADINGKVSLVESGPNIGATFTSNTSKTLATFFYSHLDNGIRRLADISNRTIHVIEGETVLLNEYMVVDSGNYGIILQLTDSSISGSSSDYFTFMDVITNEQFKVVTGYTGRGKLLIYGQTYYVNNVSSRSATTTSGGYSITWGENANYGNPGSVTTKMPRILLETGGYISFGTKALAKIVFGIPVSGEDAVLVFTNNFYKPEGCIVEKTNEITTCTDSDGYDLFTQGTTKGVFVGNDTVGTYVDYCYSGPNGVIEYFCYNNKVTQDGINCPTGYTCSNGACIVNQTTTVIECKAGQIIGDVDGNGVVTLTDANLSADIALGKINPPADLCCVDINKDGVVNVLDTVQITNIANGKMTSPGVCGQVTCTDTDGGVRYGISGECTDSTGTKADLCDGRFILEYSCENNKCKATVANCFLFGFTSCISGQCTR